MPIDNADLIDEFVEFENRGLKGAIKDLLKVYPELAIKVEEKIKK